MKKSNIAIIMIALLGIAIIVTASVLHFFSNLKTEHIVEKIVIDESEMISRIRPDRKIGEKSTFSSKFKHTTTISTLGTTISKLTSISPVQECTKQHSTSNHMLWSVTLRASTGSVGTPLKGVIQDWEIADPSMEFNEHRFELYKNGHFEIKEKGFYKILTKVTFKRDEGVKQYSMVFIDSNDKISIKSQNGTLRQDKYITRSEVCGNFKQKLTFYVVVPKASQIYLYPQLTYLSVTKYE